MARVQLSLGTGGTGVGASASARLTALRAILSAAARLRATYERARAHFVCFCKRVTFEHARPYFLWFSFHTRPYTLISFRMPPNTQ